MGPSSQFTDMYCKFLENKNLIKYTWKFSKAISENKISQFIEFEEYNLI